MIATLVLMLVATEGADARPARRVDEVPAAFVGEWTARVADCGTGDNDSRLVIMPTAIGFWESDGPLRAIVERGSNEVAMVAELRGEGSTWLRTQRFTLEGEALVDSDSVPGERFVRYRCPPRGPVREEIPATGEFLSRRYDFAEIILLKTIPTEAGRRACFLLPDGNVIVVGAGAEIGKYRGEIQAIDELHIELEWQMQLNMGDEWVRARSKWPVTLVSHPEAEECR